MNIGIIQFYNNQVDYGVYSEKINQEYCNQKGYKYICDTDSNKIALVLNGKAPTWYKPRLLQ